MADNDIASGMAVAYASMDSPLGEIWLATTPLGLCGLGLGYSEAEWREKLGLETGAAPRFDAGSFSTIVGQLAEYFSGSRRVFDLPLDLSKGTPFQRKVWTAAVGIPYGQVRSYGDVAVAIGAPRSARAVGSALGANPVLIVVPCHRVLRANGSLGGFAAGLEVKKALLVLEGFRQYQ
jgi:O-6-methylguanine DNA methyltransferase